MVFGKLNIIWNKNIGELIGMELCVFSDLLMKYISDNGDVWAYQHRELPLFQSEFENALRREMDKLFEESKKDLMEGLAFSNNEATIEEYLRANRPMPVMFWEYELKEIVDDFASGLYKKYGINDKSENEVQNDLPILLDEVLKDRKPEYFFPPIERYIDNI